MRQSCYNCQFSDRHLSDISLADFWAYRRIPSIVNDERGISLIVVNSQKGEDVLQRCKTDFYLQSIGFEYAKYNYHPCILKKEQLEKRNSFFDMYQMYGFEKAIHRFAMQKAWQFKIKHKLKILFGKYARLSNGQ